MSTMAVPRAAPPPPSRILTVADLAALPDELPSGPVKYELDNGRLIIMPVPGDSHGAIQARIAAELVMQGSRAGHGKAWAEVGVILWRNPDRVVGPDASFVVQARLPVVTSREGFLETIPDLVVEVRSKNDTQVELLAKKDDYLTSGVRLIWLIDPISRTVTIFRPDQPPRELKESDVLTADEIIPSFRLSVAELLTV